MGQDKFIELDVKKLKHIEAERKRLSETVTQESLGIHFMCCPFCRCSLSEKVVSAIPGLSDKHDKSLELKTPFRASTLRGLILS